jgi:hypothetical protein
VPPEREHRPRGERAPVVQWEELSDEDLLRVRVRDLGLRIEGSVLEGRIERLYGELESRGIHLRPPCYLADEWLCPDRVPIIGIPFFLAHPRLTQLERRMMLEVEGGTEQWCMKLLRHEAGHAISYAYRLFMRTRWRELFGTFATRYTDAYFAKPYSRRYVVHLDDNYAQAHPDEDFAETFAVWLTPGSRWEERYRSWPAIKKLNYVDHLMKEIGDRRPSVTVPSSTPWSASRMKSTLVAYYDRKRRQLGDDFPGFYDPGLQRLCPKHAEREEDVPASRFLLQHRRQIVRSVSHWTGQRKFDVDKLVRKLAMRCDALQLSLPRPAAESVFDVTAFVTAVMSNIHRFEGGTD